MSTGATWRRGAAGSLLVAACLTAGHISVAGPMQADNPRAKATPVRPRPNYPAEFTVWVEPATVEAGKRTDLKIEVAIDLGWHIYSTSMVQAATGPRKTVISLTQPSAGIKLAGEATPKEPPIRHREAAFDDLETEYHENEVIWTQPIEIAASVSPREYTLKGTIAHQLCDANSCLPPTKAEFEVKVKVRAASGASAPRSAGPRDSGASAPGPSPAPAPSTVERAEPAAKGAERPIEPPAADATASSDTITGVGTALVFGFLAGLILNVMPCVLPVISLKIYGFVKQAGDDRAQVRRLGIAFAAGILTVFLILAVFAASFRLGWGQQFSKPWFAVAMTSLIVAFTLWLFDVYTLNVPGFVGDLASGASHREGLLGSFFKGMLATLLSTPCSGPFLGTATAYALTQPTAVILSVYAAMGLGMASPYVLLAWNPGWMRFLPKPGEWMKTFKEFTGFLMLAAAVWVLWQRRKDGALVVWTVAFCLVVALAAWWYGRWAHPLAARGKQIAAPFLAVALIILGAVFCFGVMYVPVVAATAGPDGEIPWDAVARGEWIPFSQARLATLKRMRKTTVVDWTADW
jgi:thiol:disulfide interchange protein DsbD